MFRGFKIKIFHLLLKLLYFLYFVVGPFFVFLVFYFFGWPAIFPSKIRGRCVRSNLFFLFSNGIIEILN